MFTHITLLTLAEITQSVWRLVLAREFKIRNPMNARLSASVQTYPKPTQPSLQWGNVSLSQDPNSGGVGFITDHLLALRLRMGKGTTPFALFASNGMLRVGVYLYQKISQYVLFIQIVLTTISVVGANNHGYYLPQFYHSHPSE